jgi:hypothetical protein
MNIKWKDVNDHHHLLVKIYETTIDMKLLSLVKIVI